MHVVEKENQRYKKKTPKTWIEAMEPVRGFLHGKNARQMLYTGNPYASNIDSEMKAKEECS